MVKFYVICLDAFPEIPELKVYLNKNGCVKSNLVCAGAFTCSTMTSLISGCLGSEIIPSDNNSINTLTGLVNSHKSCEGGIGYNTIYHEKFLEWRKSGYCIIDRVDNIIIHNHVPWMSHAICGKEIKNKDKIKHYRDINYENEKIEIYDFGVIQNEGKIKYSSTNPEMTLNTFLKWSTLELKTKFYQNEKKYINYTQNIYFNGLLWTDLCHWHEHVYYPQGINKNESEAITKEDALNDTIEWLKFWDFNEPNSVFFIYADHSHRVQPYLDPPGYLTWLYFKDNTERNIKLNTTISSTDFYHLTEYIFDLNYIERSKWSIYPFLTENKHRIFACEDGRASGMNLTEATTFLRCKEFESFWISISKVKPNTLINEGLYIIIAHIKNKYTYTIYRYDNELKKCHEKFSILCIDGLSERKKTDIIVYELTPKIFDEINKLLLTFD